MKIVVITSSAHTRGTSNTLAGAFIKGATEAGHEVWRFDASGKRIHACLGCDTCTNKQEGCTFHDDMGPLYEHILDCDAIVFASPVYYFNVSAKLKAVIDRLYAYNEHLKGCRKAAMLIAMGDESGDSADVPTAFFNALTKYMQWVNMGVIAAKGCEDRVALMKTDYPMQAYELGKKF
ncbi:MAG: flavodoxin family protein [Marinilabiliaceae bacterium]|nr:flavodoxin family protein [Bacteroidales bacterium]